MRVISSMDVRLAHRKVSFLIFSLNSQGPRATYPRYSSDDRLFTFKRTFHIRGRSVESYWKVRSPLYCNRIKIAEELTMLFGIPAMRISRLNFFNASSALCVDRVIPCELGGFRIFLNALATFCDESADCDELAITQVR